MRGDTCTPPSDAVPIALLIVLGAFIACAPFSIAASQTALGLSILLWIFFLIRRKAPAPRRTMLDAPLALFIGSCVVAALSSSKRLESFAGLKNLLLMSTIPTVGFLAASARSRGRFLAALLVSGGGSAVYGIVIYALGKGEGALGRSPGTFSNAMTFGGVLLIVCSLFCAAAMIPGIGRKLRAAVIAGAFAALAALFFSFTRSSWVGMLVSLVVILAVLRRKLLVPFLASVVVFVFLLPAPYRERVESIWNPAFRTNVQRLELVRGGLSIFREHPVTGVGTMDLGETYRTHMPPGAVHVHGHMHNDFLQIAVQTGAVGLVAFCALLVSFFVLIGRNLKLDLGPGDRAWVVGALGALAGFIVNGLFEWNFGDAEVVTLLYIVIAANLAIRLEHLRVRH
jgi:O-antigen ligase